MATLRDIRHRIRSVRGTAQITRAMKMIAGARLRRAQERMLAMRPYVRELSRLVAGMLGELKGDEHALLAGREPARAVALLAVSPDRGLCGGLPGNIAKNAARIIEEERASGRTVHLFVSGKKGKRALSRMPGAEVAYAAEGGSERPRAADAEKFAAEIMRAFASGKVDAASVLYAGFRSAVSQEMVTRTLFPVSAEELRDELGPEVSPAPCGLAEIEPGPEGLARALLQRHMGAKIYLALLEGASSELGARLTAMDAATRNAEDLEKELTLELNKARQAAITEEMLDIIGGAEALKSA